MPYVCLTNYSQPHIFGRIFKRGEKIKTEVEAESLAYTIPEHA